MADPESKSTAASSHSPSAAHYSDEKATAIASKEVPVEELYETPPPEAFTSFSALKARIKQHYDVASDYYYSLW